MQQEIRKIETDVIHAMIRRGFSEQTAMARGAIVARGWKAILGRPIVEDCRFAEARSERQATWMRHGGTLTDLEALEEGDQAWAEQVAVALEAQAKAK